MLSATENATRFRVMVRSFEGWNPIRDAGYERRIVWSTYETADTREEAERHVAELNRGGVVAVVISPNSYAHFCASHIIA